MTEGEYQKEKESLETEHKKNVQELSKSCAFSNKLYDIGDTISVPFKSETFVIDDIKWSYNFGHSLPCCVYYGNLLTAKMVLRKDGKRGSAYESRDITLIKKGDTK